VRTCTLTFLFLIAESVRLTLLPKKKPKKKLKWSEDTIDNENMGKKKSKSKSLTSQNSRLSRLSRLSPPPTSVCFFFFSFHVSPFTSIERKKERIGSILKLKLLFPPSSSSFCFQNAAFFTRRSVSMRAQVTRAQVRVKEKKATCVATTVCTRNSPYSMRCPQI